MFKYFLSYKIKQDKICYITRKKEIHWSMRKCNRWKTYYILYLLVSSYGIHQDYGSKLNSFVRYLGLGLMGPRGSGYLGFDYGALGLGVYGYDKKINKHTNCLLFYEIKVV